MSFLRDLIRKDLSSRVLALLARSEGEADLTRLREELRLSETALATHLRLLERAGYLQTRLFLTPAGRNAVKRTRG